MDETTPVNVGCPDRARALGREFSVRSACSSDSTARNSSFAAAGPLAHRRLLREPEDGAAVSVAVRGLPAFAEQPLHALDGVALGVEQAADAPQQSTSSGR